MRYYDVHAHLADPRVLGGMPALLSECERRGVGGILANAARLGEWPTITELARHPPVLGALGLHPFFLDEWSDDLPDKLRLALRAHERLRAVGEIGLDFFHGREDSPLQVHVFAAQLAVALERRLPVILHNRKSWPEFFSVLREMNATPLCGVCHHFSASKEIARQVLDLGLDVSFCGPITYPNARRLRTVAQYVPLNRILTETDTPDLPAARYRGEYSCPYHVSEIVHELAALKGVQEAEIAEHVEENFMRLFAVHRAGAPPNGKPSPPTATSADGARVESRPSPD